MAKRAVAKSFVVKAFAVGALLRTWALATADLSALAHPDDAGTVDGAQLGAWVGLLALYVQGLDRNAWPTARDGLDAVRATVAACALVDVAGWPGPRGGVVGQGIAGLADVLLGALGRCVACGVQLDDPNATGGGDHAPDCAWVADQCAQADAGPSK